MIKAVMPFWGSAFTQPREGLRLALRVIGFIVGLGRG
jgi:hypothetical protein